jgi:hypothetical protein
MKIILSIIILFIGLTATFSQTVWNNVPQTNLQYNPNNTRFEMVGDDLFAVTVTATPPYMMNIEKYNEYSLSWNLKRQISVSSMNRFDLISSGNELGIAYVATDGVHFVVERYNTSSNQLLPTETTTYTNGLIATWNTALHYSSNNLIIAFSTYSNSVYNFTLTGTTWTYQDLTLLMNPYANQIYDNTIDAQMDEQFGYLAFSDGVKTRLIKKDMIANTPFNVYSTDSLIHFNTTSTLAMDATLIMNGTSAADMQILKTEFGQSSFEIDPALGTTNVEPGTGRRPNYNKYAKDHNGVASILFSAYNTDYSLGILGTDSTRVLKRYDNQDYVHFLPGLPNMNTSTTQPLSACISHSNQDRVFVKYQDQTGANHLKITNKAPSLAAGQNPNLTFCAGQGYTMFDGLSIEDLDPNAKITITSITGGGINSFNWENLGLTGPNLTKFKITSSAPIAGNITLFIDFTDGYATVSQSINFTVTAGSTTNPIVLTSTPIQLCDNVDYVNLNDFVSPAGGTFTLDGALLNGSLVAPTALVAATTILYTVENANCFFSLPVPFQMNAAPTLILATIPTTCATSLGSIATSSLVATGTAIYDWSTGSTLNYINGLETGTYTLHVTDATGCSNLYTGSVASSDISIIPTITNVTCFGGNDGSISLSGLPVDATVVWMDGQSGLVANQLTAGQYWVNIDLTGGCNLSSIYTITEPVALNITFTEYEPDCADTNGNIYSGVTGGSGAYSYLWEDGSTGVDLLGKPYGFYNLQVTDANNCVADSSFALDEWQAMGIISNIQPTACGTPNGGIDLTFTASGTQFQVAALWNDGVTTFNRNNLENQHYQVDILASNGCHSVLDCYVPLLAPVQQNICIVSVDTATTTNLVIWEKSVDLIFDYYKIYRENFTSGSFTLIDTIAYTNLSVFNDVIAFADERAWKYAISAVDACGAESPRSTIHETMYLNTIILGTTDNKVYWNNYIGAPFNAYKVIRYSTENGWEQIATVPASAGGEYIDNSIAGLSGFDYLIELDLGFSCSATFGKANDYNYTRSNKERGITNPGQGTGDPSNYLSELNVLNLKVYPNPSYGIFNIQQDNKDELRITIYDLQGKLLQELSSSENSIEIDLSNLNNGLYLLKIKSLTGSKEIKITKI